MKRHRHIAINDLHVISDTGRTSRVRVALGRDGTALTLDVKEDGRFELYLEHEAYGAQQSTSVMYGAVRDSHLELHGVPTPFCEGTGPDGEGYVVPIKLPPTVEVRGERTVSAPARDAGETGRLAVTDPAF